MATQSNIFLTGRMDNIIFYQRDGKFFARSMPNKVKQTPATKKRSRNFGIASSAGRTLRSSLLPSLPFPKDKHMQSRFSGAIAKWLGVTDIKNLQSGNIIPHITGFNFNPKTGIAERCRVAIDVSRTENNLIEVAIPAFVPVKKIIAPAHTTKVLCTVTVASCNLKKGTSSGSSTTTLEIPYNEVMFKKQALSFPVRTSMGNLVITAISLRFILSGNKPSENISFMPSSVIDARYY